MECDECEDCGSEIEILENGECPCVCHELENEMIEMRTFCSSCDPAVAECAPKKMIPTASISPELLEIVRQRGYMSSHEDCAYHLGKQIKAEKLERAEWDREHAK